MPPLYRTVNLSQHNELPDREVAELRHSKTGLFAVTATENSHHSSVLVTLQEPTSHFLVLNQCNGLVPATDSDADTRRCEHAYISRRDTHAAARSCDALCGISLYLCQIEDEWAKTSLSSSLRAQWSSIHLTWVQLNWTEQWSSDGLSTTSLLSSIAHLRSILLCTTEHPHTTPLIMTWTSFAPEGFNAPLFSSPQSNRSDDKVIGSYEMENDKCVSSPAQAQCRFMSWKNESGTVLLVFKRYFQDKWSSKCEALLVMRTYFYILIFMFCHHLLYIILLATSHCLWSTFLFLFCKCTGFTGMVAAGSVTCICDGRLSYEPSRYSEVIQVLVPS